MARIETWLKCNLGSPVKTQYLDGNIFSMDNQANLIGVEVFEPDGTPSNLSGIVSANVVRSDGGTVAVSGGVIIGNKASVILPQAAYTVPGIIAIFVKLTSDEVITTIGALIANVYQTSTDSPVDPGTIIPSVEALIEQINDAIASIPEDYSSLWATVVDLKSALDYEVEANSTSALYDYSLEQGTINSSTGGNTSRTTRIRTTDYIKIDKLISVEIPSGLKMSISYYGSNTVASYIKTVNWFTGNVGIDPIGKYCRLVFGYENDGTIEPSVFPDSQISVRIYKNQNESLIDTHDTSKRYQKGDIVLKDNEPYISKENNVIGAWDGSKWEKTNIQNKIWNDIKNYIDSDSPTEGIPYIFVDGGISSSDGSAMSNSKRIRTYSFVPIGSGFYFTIPNGMKAFVSYYETEDYASWIGITDWSTNSVYYVINPVAKYCKIVFGYVNESGIDPNALPNSRITISKYKSIKDAFFQIQRLLDLTRIVLYDEVVQGVHGPGGSITQSTRSLTFKQVMYIGVGKTIELHLKDGWDYSLLSGPQPNNMKFKFRHIKNRFITLSDDYVAINITKIDPENEGSYLDITPADFDNALIVTMSDSSTDDDTVYDPPESLGQMNCVLRAKQATTITYVATALLPNQSKDYPSGSSIMGIPYSSTRYENNYVPNCVSFDSFMTATMNPNSYLYTRVVTADDGTSRLGNSKTYFGSVCSSFVSYCLGFDGIVYTTHQLGEISGITELEEQNCYALKLGDVLLDEDNHVVIVTEIARTKKGKIKYVEISESWPPFCKSTQYTIDGMYERFFDPETGYKACRYDLSNVTYTPSPWVNIDDETGNPVYNNLLIPRRGDKANWLYGETVEIDIMNSQDYTHYKLYKNDTLVSTVALPQSLISLSGLSYGEYKLCMTDGTNDSDFVYWIVVATPTIQAEYVGNKTVHVVFGCQNAEAMSINWCRANRENLRHLYAVYSATLLTSEEKSAGEVTNTYDGSDWDSLVQSDSGKFFINIKFKTKYGIFSKDYVEITVT